MGSGSFFLLKSEQNWLVISCPNYELFVLISHIIATDSQIVKSLICESVAVNYFSKLQFIRSYFPKGIYTNKPRKIRGTQ